MDAFLKCTVLMNIKGKSALLELFTWIIIWYKIYNLKNWHTGNLNLLPWSGKTKNNEKLEIWHPHSDVIEVSSLLRHYCVSNVLVVFMFRVNQSLCLQRLNALWNKLNRICSNGQFPFLEDRQALLWDLHCCLLKIPENWTINYTTILLSYSPSINRLLNSLISVKTLTYFAQNKSYTKEFMCRIPFCNIAFLLSVYHRRGW